MRAVRGVLKRGRGAARKSVDDHPGDGQDEGRRGVVLGMHGSCDRYVNARVWGDEELIVPCRQFGQGGGALPLVRPVQAYAGRRGGE